MDLSYTIAILRNDQINNKILLQTSGYPRSGNSYLNQALNLLYYPDEQINMNLHNWDSLRVPGIKIVPFRSPLDVTASWYLHPDFIKFNYGRAPTFQGVVDYYIVFHNVVLDNLDNVCLMDFNEFTKNVDYIKNKIYYHFKLESEFNVTDIEIKHSLLNNEHFNGLGPVDRRINLPRNNKEEMDRAKAEIIKIKIFDQCLEIYRRLNNESNNINFDTAISKR